MTSRKRIYASELATGAIVLATLAGVMTPGVLGWQGSTKDRQTQRDLSKVASVVSQMHALAVRSGAELTNIGVESASADRVRAFPATGPAQLLGVSEGTTVLGSNGLTHYRGGEWCLAFTNPHGRIKTYHSHSVRGLDKGECPR